MRLLPRRLQPGGRRSGARQRQTAHGGSGDRERHSRGTVRGQGRVQQPAVRLRHRRADVQRVEGGGAGHDGRAQLPQSSRRPAGGQRRAEHGLPVGAAGRRHPRGRDGQNVQLHVVPHAAGRRRRLQQGRRAHAERSAQARPVGRELLDLAPHQVPGSAGHAASRRRVDRAAARGDGRGPAAGRGSAAHGGVTPGDRQQREDPQPHRSQADHRLPGRPADVAQREVVRRQRQPGRRGRRLRPAGQTGRPASAVHESRRRHDLPAPVDFGSREHPGLRGPPGDHAGVGGNAGIDQPRTRPGL